MSDVSTLKINHSAFAEAVTKLRSEADSFERAKETLDSSTQSLCHSWKGTSGEVYFELVSLFKETMEAQIASLRSIATNLQSTDEAFKDADQLLGNSYQKGS